MLLLTDTDLVETLAFFKVTTEEDLKEFCEKLKISSQRDFITMQDAEVEGVTRYTPSGPLAHYINYKDLTFRIPDNVKNKVLDAAIEVAKKKIK